MTCNAFAFVVIFSDGVGMFLYSGFNLNCLFVSPTYCILQSLYTGYQINYVSCFAVNRIILLVCVISYIVSFFRI